MFKVLEQHSTISQRLRDGRRDSYAFGPKSRYFVTNPFGRNVDLKALQLPSDVVEAFGTIAASIGFETGSDQLRAALVAVAEEFEKAYAIDFYQ